MPASQIAALNHFYFGAPVAEAEAIRFSVKQGGKVLVRLSAEETQQDLTLTLQVSDDGTTFADTSAANNITVVADVVIQSGTYRDYTINLRAGIDNYLRVQASGGGKGFIQIRESSVNLVIQ